MGPRVAARTTSGSTTGPSTSTSRTTSSTARAARSTPSRSTSGLKIKYTEGYNDNNEYFAKIQPLLSKGEPIGPNIIAPTFWMAGRLLGLGWLDKLPLDKIPNAANLLTSLQKPPSDPTGEYSLPWQSGIAGIAYNQEVTGREI